LRGELGGVEDVFFEELYFVAAELLYVLASDACCGLSEDFDVGIVYESAGVFFGRFA
jgi:hypothetical protein